MLNITLELHGEKIPLRIRTGWHEVSTAHYAQIVELEGDALLAGVLEVDVDLVEELPEAVKAQLSTLLAWVSTDLPTEAKPKKLPQETGWWVYGQFEQARQALARHGMWGGAPYVYAMFMYPWQRRFLDPNYKWNNDECMKYAEKVKTMPISETYGPFKHFTQQIGAFVEKYKHLLKTEPDDIEEHAGVARFTKYGFFATLWHKTAGDPTRFDDMIQVPADVFYTALAMGTEVEEYQQNLRDIKQRVNQFED